MDGKERPEGVIHEYDGIQEADNALPNWWLAILFGTIAFGAVYWLSAESFKSTSSPGAAYKLEMERVAAAEAERLKSAGTVTDDGLLAMTKDPKSLDEGKAAFLSNCAPCHAANGGGGIGPNLTDSAWLHGGSPTRIYATIKEGFTAKGMPAWGGSLGEERVRLVAAYVVSLKNGNVPGGKPPQGEAEK